MEGDELRELSCRKAGREAENDEDDRMDVDSQESQMEYIVKNVESLESFIKAASRAFFDEFGLIHHQICSFNQLIDGGIQALFDSLGEIVVEPSYDPSGEGGGGEGGGDRRRATITYGKVKLEMPTFWSEKNGEEEELKLFPRHARLQNMTYSSRMKVEVSVQVYAQEKNATGEVVEGPNIYKMFLSEEKKEIVIGRVPIMVKSKQCWLDKLNKTDCLFDAGGYFIVKGAEKVFIAQEQRCLTRLWITDRPTWMASYSSENRKKKVYVKLVDASEMGAHGRKVITINFLYATMPVWIMFFALGATSDKEVFHMIDLGDCDPNLTNIVWSTIRDADKQCDCFRKEGKSREYVDTLIKSTKFPPTESFDEYISNYFFPAISGHHEKALFLGYFVKCLLLGYCGKRKCDNRTDFRNKRLDLVGELLARELRSHIRHAEKRMKRTMQRDMFGNRDLQLIERYWDASIITNGLNRAFSLGAWCHPYKRTVRTSGVVATLQRTNALQMTSDMRKTRQQVAYAGKSGESRYPNPSYWGKLCFLSTPDGENCGLVKNLAITALVSMRIGESILGKLVSCGMEKFDELSIASLSKMDKIFLNGDWIGVCMDSKLFVENFRHMRRTKLIDYQVEIRLDKHQREVRIFSDPGRLLRPLLVVENLRKIGNLKAGFRSFQSLVNEGIVEFIGAEEEEDCVAAWGIRYLLQQDSEQPAYTHCEFDPSFIMGLSCSIIPFANHNFARRILFQAQKHSHQAIGCVTTNPQIRVDTLMQQMYYPQRPLFKTMVADCLSGSRYFRGLERSKPRPELFNGQNAIVAVNVHMGYNQEDSLVMNQASLDRGMFRTEYFRNYRAETDNKEMNKRAKPKDKVMFGKTQSKKGRVDSLDDDGFPKIGASLHSADIIIGKVAESGEDHSVKLRHTEQGRVQKVVLSANDDGKNYAAVILRQVRSPGLGDKFSSMHGQKGVVGFLESQENFPFTSQGIVPDIVINPHAFPSRQTPGQLLESALGKGIALCGTTKYATPFTTPSVDVITEQLHRLRFQRWGSERVVNGHTGELMESMIFIGPTFYQRLAHMAEDKVKYRNTGPVHPMTRQPVADRKRFGGVKFGEMERDCLLAHGAAANLRERLFTLSDFSHMHICRNCQRAANVILRMVVDRKIRGPYCGFCKTGENVVRIDVPYGSKLLYHELLSMGVCLKFSTELC